MNCEGCGWEIPDDFESPASDLCAGCYSDLAIGKRLYKLKCFIGWLLARLRPRHKRLFDIRQQEAMDNLMRGSGSGGTLSP